MNRQPGMTECDRAHLELVRQARAGDRASLDTLAARVRERVHRYLNRVTLDEERSQDLTQETLVAVLESLATLKRVDRFWPWVFRIAGNKTRQHYRHEARRRTVQMSALDEAHLPTSSDIREEGLGRLSRKELGELTREAMTQISERYRMVLALRLFEDMPHAQIAQALGCSELSARATFFRAKHALAQALKRRGVQGSAFVAALAAFGELTAPSPASAAVTVSASAAAESVVTGLLSAKAKVAAAAIAAVIAVAFVWDPDWGGARSSSGPAIRSVHFAHQVMAAPGAGGSSSSQSFGCYEQWYHFPDGVDGPFLFRMQRWTPDRRQRQCGWVQNADAYYYVHSGKKTIYIENARMYSATGLVNVLPTDSQAFCAFVRKIEGQRSRAMTDTPQITYKRDPKTGFALSRVDRRFPELGAFETVYDYSPLDLKLFDAPSGMKVVDQRDAMHKRGWTYFRLEGQLAGRGVSGVGRLPFVHSACKTHSPWLKLNVDGRLAAVDNGTHAWLLDHAGRVTRVYPGGGLFWGLSRPWTGFHTLDTVRRDAAAEEIWFSTGLFEEEEHADVTIVEQRDGLHCKLRYTVDLNRDTLTRIDLWLDEDDVFAEPVGDLTFSYLNEIKEGDEESVTPAWPGVSPSARTEDPTLLWPLQLFDIIAGVSDSTKPEPKEGERL